ncbi:MAG: translation elongation factor Ts [Coriobacteriales bacterium]|jgi:elongation factor Ts|nr:translation elongation factor Ts [Coriobacteriales bacterium]
MSEITAQMVKQLREMTGAGMMECKRALEETAGDIEAAVDVLRTRGLAAAAKKAGRATNEGLIVAAVSADGLAAAMAEVNCETDFVSRNEVFQGYAAEVVAAVLNTNPVDAEALLAAPTSKETVGEMITEAIHTIGENIQISHFVRTTVDCGLIASYIHAGGRLGVLVTVKLGNQSDANDAEIKALAKDIAMQVAAANPGAVSRADFDSGFLEREMAIYIAQAAESGKPEEIQAKMAEGRMEKFFKDSALLEQAFIKDPDKTIKQVIDAVAKTIGTSIEVTGFQRFELGQN